MNYCLISNSQEDKRNTGMRNKKTCLPWWWFILCVNLTAEMLVKHYFKVRACLGVPSGDWMDLESRFKWTDWEKQRALLNVGEHQAIGPGPTQNKKLGKSSQSRTSRPRQRFSQAFWLRWTHSTGSSGSWGIFSLYNPLSPTAHLLIYLVCFYLYILLVLFLWSTLIIY